MELHHAAGGIACDARDTQEGHVIVPPLFLIVVQGAPTAGRPRRVRALPANEWLRTVDPGKEPCHLHKDE